MFWKCEDMPETDALNVYSIKFAKKKKTTLKNMTNRRYAKIGTIICTEHLPIHLSLCLSPAFRPDVRLRVHVQFAHDEQKSC